MRAAENETLASKFSWHQVDELGDPMLLEDVVDKHEREILRDWLRLQTRAGSKTERISQDQLGQESKGFLSEVRKALRSGEASDITAPAWQSACELLREVSQSRAAQGYSPSETATFVFSLKQPLFDRIAEAAGGDARKLQDELWRAGSLLDKLALYATEAYQKGREGLVSRQQQEMLELSTPVVALWDRVLAVPLIGSLDAARAQTAMETLLQRIVEVEAEIAIIDITGVPMVDTLVAQNLLKTVAAARLMGAECIISGIRPQIAQTIVRLGVQLDVVSKRTLADAFALALRRLGLSIAPADQRN
jgi:rsbT co-antagonist protein RsbR